MSVGAKFINAKRAGLKSATGVGKRKNLDNISNYNRGILMDKNVSLENKIFRKGLYDMSYLKKFIISNLNSQ
jgi:hypothetical protein